MSRSGHIREGFRGQAEASRFENRSGAVVLLTDKHNHCLFFAQN